MKRLLLIIALTFSALLATAQTESKDSLDIQSVIDACINLRDAVANDDTAAIRQSATEMRALQLSGFGSLRCWDDTIASLNGHLVFDENFADSIVVNKEAFNRADEINRETEALRGQNPDGSIATKSCFVKAKSSTTYSFRAKGYQELAVVAEAGGLVTMKIHVTNIAGLDERHDDTKDVLQGQSYRKTSFDLPTDLSNLVELVVFNCGDKDISFVVISN